MSRKVEHQPESIGTRKQLLVEGDTPRIFFREWLRTLGLHEEVQVWSFGGNDELDEFLHNFTRLPGFRDLVVSLGIVRDAEGSPADSALASVCSSLVRAGLNRPGGFASFSKSKPRTCIYVLPDCQNAGMLETLCWSLLRDDLEKKGHLDCVNQHLECLRGAKVEVGNLDKAMVGIYLAVIGVDPPRVGRAAKEGVWDWKSPSLSRLAEFLKAL